MTSGIRARICSLKSWLPAVSPVTAASAPGTRADGRRDRSCRAASRARAPTPRPVPFRRAAGGRSATCRPCHLDVKGGKISPLARARAPGRDRAPHRRRGDVGALHRRRPPAPASRGSPSGSPVGLHRPQLARQVAEAGQRQCAGRGAAARARRSNAVEATSAARGRPHREARTGAPDARLAAAVQEAMDEAEPRLVDARRLDDEPGDGRAVDGAAQRGEQRRQRRRRSRRPRSRRRPSPRGRARRRSCSRRAASPPSRRSRSARRRGPPAPRSRRRG